MDEGIRFSTHSSLTSRLSVVCEPAASPSIASWPSHHADDIGARLVLPSGLSDEMTTTGVPK
jgi:hypothetical protein